MLSLEMSSIQFLTVDIDNYKKRKTISQEEKSVHTDSHWYLHTDCSEKRPSRFYMNSLFGILYNQIFVQIWIVQKI